MTTWCVGTARGTHGLPAANVNMGGGRKAVRLGAARSPRGAGERSCSGPCADDALCPLPELEILHHHVGNRPASGENCGQQVDRLAPDFAPVGAQLDQRGGHTPGQGLEVDQEIVPPAQHVGHLRERTIGPRGAAHTGHTLRGRRREGERTHWPRSRTCTV